MPKPNRFMFRTITEMRQPCQHPGAATAIVITHNCRFDLFAQSLLSLLLRTEPYEYLSKVLVILNGSGLAASDEILDRKQAFLRDLAGATYGGRRVPLATMRVQGIGQGLTHSACLDAAMSFITSEFFLSMHDDVIVLDPTWPARVAAHFARPEVALVGCPRLLMCRVQETHAPVRDERRILLVPHPNTCFLSGRTDTFFELGGRWLGYCVNLPEPMPTTKMEPNLDGLQRFYDHHTELPGETGVEAAVLDPEAKPFTTVGHDVGAWYLNSLWANGYRGAAIPGECIAHVVSASWHPADETDGKLKNEFGPRIKDIHNLILATPEFAGVYAKHMTTNGFGQLMPMPDEGHDGLTAGQRQQVVDGFTAGADGSWPTLVGTPRDGPNPLTELFEASRDVSHENGGRA